MENDVAKFAKKFLIFSSEVSAVIKDRKNPHFRSIYADINSFIEEVKPALEKAGLAILQPITTELVRSGSESGEDVTILHFLNTHIIDTETGYMQSSRMLLDEDGTPQQKGSMITYFRRYMLQSMCFLMADDDDGESSKRVVDARKREISGEAPKPKKFGASKK